IERGNIPGTLPCYKFMRRWTEADVVFEAVPIDKVVTAGIAWGMGDRVWGMGDGVWSIDFFFHPPYPIPHTPPSIIRNFILLEPSISECLLHQFEMCSSTVGIEFDHTPLFDHPPKRCAMLDRQIIRAQMIGFKRNGLLQGMQQRRFSLIRQGKNE